MRSNVCSGMACACEKLYSVVTLCHEIPALAVTKMSSVTTPLLVVLRIGRTAEMDSSSDHAALNGAENSLDVPADLAGQSLEDHGLSAPALDRQTQRRPASRALIDCERVLNTGKCVLYATH